MPCDQDLAGLAPAPVGLERIPEMGDVALERGGGGIGWVWSPEDLEEPVGRHHPPRVDDQSG